jgi:hypothetical protein
MAGLIVTYKGPRVSLQELKKIEMAKSAGEKSTISNI